VYTEHQSLLSYEGVFYATRVDMLSWYIIKVSIHDGKYAQGTADVGMRHGRAPGVFFLNKHFRPPHAQP